MLNFDFYSKTRIYFGPDRTSEIGNILKSFSVKKPLVVIGKGGHTKRCGLLDKVTSSLDENGIEHVVFDEVTSNPTLDIVQKGIDIFRENKCDFVLSIGGGSVIDTGKAIALGLGCRDAEELWTRCFLSYENVSTDIQNGVILTTASSGSETGESAVISHEGKKLIGTSSDVAPLFAVLDPVNTLSVPPYQTACGLADILSHLEERYFTSENHNDLSDKLLEASMRNIIQNGTLLMKHPDSLTIRENVMWTGTLAHNPIFDRGRGSGDWACHFIEHELSARFDLAHGEGIAMITPSWLKYVSEKPECRLRLMQFAVNVWGADFPYDETSAIEWAIMKQSQWYTSLGLRTSLVDFEGLDEEKIKEMAGCFSGYNIGSFCSLGEKEVYEILQRAAEV